MAMTRREFVKGAGSAVVAASMLGVGPAVAQIDAADTPLSARATARQHVGTPARG